MRSPELLSAAMLMLSSGRWLEAETAARAAVTGGPPDSRATLLLALAIAAMGEPERAAPVMVDLAASQPDADHPCVELVRLHPKLPHCLIDRQFRTCLRLVPADQRLRLAFAQFLLDTDQAANAEATLAAEPATAAGHHLKGLARAELNRFPEAIESFQCAVGLDPDAAASWSNLGMMLKVEGRFAEAADAHDRAVALEPLDHRFRVNRAVALLKMGDWEPAWRDYESRLPLAGAPPIGALRLMPSLHTDERLDGLTILALHEEGFGDTLQFLRYLPLLAERGARVVACVPPVLARIMRRVPGVAAVVTDIGAVPAHDFVCPMFSLPRVFATTIDTIPPVPVLDADPEPTQSWTERLPTGVLRVGLVWAGQARPSAPGFGTLDRRRSAGLAEFAPLAELTGVALVSLQAGPAARQQRPAGLAMLDPMPGTVDFADTAAIVAALDVVVSVDSSVVHLAGLIGKPTLLLDRYDGCWRWLADWADTPWYPSLTIFRQDRPGDWTGAMARVARVLNAMARSRGFTPTPPDTREPSLFA